MWSECKFVFEMADDGAEEAKGTFRSTDPSVIAALESFFNQKFSYYFVVWECSDSCTLRKVIGPTTPFNYSNKAFQDKILIIVALNNYA